MKQKISNKTKDKIWCGVLVTSGVIVCTSLMLTLGYYAAHNSRVKYLKCWVAKKQLSTHVVDQREEEQALLTLSYKVAYDKPLVVDMYKNSDPNYQDYVIANEFNDITVGDQVILSYVTSKYKFVDNFLRLHGKKETAASNKGRKPYQYYYVGRANLYPKWSIYVPTNEEEFLGY